MGLKPRFNRYRLPRPDEDRAGKSAVYLNDVEERNITDGALMGMEVRRSPMYLET